MFREYDAWNPDASSREVIDQANGIIAAYAAQGYELTLRQLYYQFVARDLIPNNQRSYKRLGSIIDKGRKAGLVDWGAIVDRTRNLESLAHWATPSVAMRALANQYRFDLWDRQPTRVEVWVEKEALAGVVARAADAYDCAWFSCRGYVSQSEQWEAGRRIGRYLAGGQNVVILHLGDHDPSGIDMTRDIRDRLTNFVLTDWHYEQMTELSTTTSVIRSRIEEHLAERREEEEMPEPATTAPLTVRRIALNMDQVEQYEPPPNFAKITDSRFTAYQEQYGDDSWELDALEPAVLVSLIQEHILAEMDADTMAEDEERMETQRQHLVDMADNFNAVVNHLAELGS